MENEILSSPVPATPDPNHVKAGQLLGILILLSIAALGWLVYTRLTLQPGHTVLAEWVPHTWYQGVISRSCTLPDETRGYEVLFSAGDVKCFAKTAIVRDRIPKKITKNERIISRWIGEAYYDATIQDILPDGRYSLIFYDLIEHTATREDIRIVTQ